MEQRRKGHLAMLRRGRHSNQVLQDAFNQYGQAAFVFAILEENVNPYRETHWIKELNTLAPNGFNIRVEDQKAVSPPWRMVDAFSHMKFDVSDPVQASIRVQLVSVISVLAQAHVEDIDNVINSSAWVVSSSVPAALTGLDKAEIQAVTDRTVAAIFPSLWACRYGLPVLAAAGGKAPLTASSSSAMH
jgi:hypothetical protein